MEKQPNKSEKGYALTLFYDNKGQIVWPNYFVPKSSDYSLISDQRVREKVETETLSLKEFDALSFDQQLLVGRSSLFGSKMLWERKSLRSPPILKEQSLWNHQLGCVQWMIDCERKAPHYGITGGVVSLQMGLGKTLIALFLSLAMPRGCGPTLVVCSKTLASFQWPQEVAKQFGENVKVLFLTKDVLGKDIEKVTKEFILAHDIVVTTYETCQSACKKGEYHEKVRIYGESGPHKDHVIKRIQREKETVRGRNLTGIALLYEITWERVVCDESQKFSNPDSKCFEAMISLYGTHKWCLTGTMLRNDAIDIWPQLFFCGYTGAENKRVWKRSCARLIYSQNLCSRIKNMTYETEGIVMPELKTIQVDVPFSSKELLIYRSVLENARDILSRVIVKQLKFSELLAVFMALRKSCLCSTLSFSRSGEFISKIETKDELKKWLYSRKGGSGRHCSKANKLVEILKGSPDEKFLVFSSFSSYLRILKKRLKEEGITFALLVGDCKQSEREEILKGFRKGLYRVLLLTYKVGSEGLNLTEATGIVLMDPWWNRAVTNQAYQRAWRIGQTRAVKVYSLIFVKSIETQILCLCDHKDSLSDYYLSGGRNGTVPKKKASLDIRTLRKLLTNREVSGEEVIEIDE